ncbi:MAG: DUF819 family protein [Victivallales bacterium]|nr:DUF819 family protein [Victivallales bacterium]MCF7889571.1 DUF819 family protein [Victivallales bacterium]
MQHLAFIHDSFGIAAVLITVPAVIFSLASHSKFAKFFSIVPPLVFAYFVPTLLATLNIIPSQHETYSYIKSYILPASLLLLTISVDLKGIFKLGFKAVFMLIAATFGIVIGGPIAFFFFKNGLPPDAWKGFAALAGSWIGGGANFIAVGNSVGTPDSIMGMMVIVDVLTANIWTGILLYLTGREKQIDGFMKADSSAIQDLKDKMVNFQEETKRIATTKDYMVMVSMAFLCTWIAAQLGNLLPELGSVISHGTWKIILITTIGVIFSFTPIRNFEGAGASKIGTLFLYILIGTIGANADVIKVFTYPYLFFTGVVWILIHISIITIAMWLIRAPLFFMAVGSQANIGGAASAPIVASAFHPALATVGVMMGIAGYVLGTYCALLCAALIQWVNTM